MPWSVRKACTAQLMHTATSKKHCAPLGMTVGVTALDDCVLCCCCLLQALGVLLYVLCFGRLPFAGDSKLQIINARYDLPRSGHNRPQQVRQAAGWGGVEPAQQPWAAGARV